MKTIIISLIIVGIFAQSGWAQKQWKGPKAKNFKIWEHEFSDQKIESAGESFELLKGPKAKNSHNQWKHKSNGLDSLNLVPVNFKSSQEHSLKGPNAKNKASWQRRQRMKDE